MLGFGGLRGSDKFRGPSQVGCSHMVNGSKGRCRPRETPRGWMTARWGMNPYSPQPGAVGVLAGEGGTGTKRLRPVRVPPRKIRTGGTQRVHGYWTSLEGELLLGVVAYNLGGRDAHGFLSQWATGSGTECSFHGKRFSCQPSIEWSNPTIPVLLPAAENCDPFLFFGALFAPYGQIRPFRM